MAVDKSGTARDAWQDGRSCQGGRVAVPTPCAAAPHPQARPFWRVAITDRHGCPRPLPQQVERLAGHVDALILREKDMDPAAYERLARAVRAACECAGIAFIAHSFAEPARRTGATRLHLPLPLLERTGRPEGFELVGTNVHEVAEVPRAEALGADYLIASPVFAPSCKPVPGRGTAFLEEVIAQAHVPVLALGGITDQTEPLVRATAAAGACRMSAYMRL